MCHVLKSVTEGEDAENSSGPSEEQIDDLGRYVNPAQLSLLSVTICVRIVCHIESVVGERANCARDLREHHPGSTDECLMAWRAEIWEILRDFDVRGSQLTISSL